MLEVWYARKKAQLCYFYNLRKRSIIAETNCEQNEYTVELLTLMVLQSRLGDKPH